jgi:hypothetical protein
MTLVQQKSKNKRNKLDIFGALCERERERERERETEEAVEERSKMPTCNVFVTVTM